MMKIINWFFGSFFKSLGRFISFILIGVLIALLIAKSGFKIDISKLLGIQRVLALSSGYSKFEGGLCTGSSDPFTCTWSPSISLNSNYVFGTQNIDKTINEFNFRFYGGSSYVYNANNLYTAKIKFSLGSSLNGSSLNNFYNNLARYLKNYYYVIRVNGNISSSHSGNSSDYISDYTYSIEQVPDTNDYILTVNFTPKVDLKYFVVYFYRRDPENVIFAYSYLIKSASLSYAEGLNASIDRQTGVIKEGTDKINDNLSDLNDNINNSDTSSSTGEAGGFFSNFNTSTFGLTSIITAPLNSINNLASSVCSPLQVPLPFVDTNLTLPCMGSIYESKFGLFYNIYKIIITGIISYYIVVRIFNLVKDFKNPDHDEIEVVDL